MFRELLVSGTLVGAFQAVCFLLAWLFAGKSDFLADLFGLLLVFPGGLVVLLFQENLHSPKSQWVILPMVVISWVFYVLIVLYWRRRMRGHRQHRR